LEEHILDLDKRLWATSRFGLTAVGTWARIDDRWRPCMVILLNKSATLRPAIIPIDDAWKWSDIIGTPVPLATRMLGFLGVAGTEENIFKLITLVNSRMQDLLSIPPRPRDAEEHAEPVAELTIDNPVHNKIEIEI
jgi:hypothetical protein